MTTCKSCTHYKMCAINIPRDDVPCKEFQDKELVLTLPISKKSLLEALVEDVRKDGNYES